MNNNSMNIEKLDFQLSILLERMALPMENFKLYHKKKKKKGFLPKENFSLDNFDGQIAGIST